MKRILTIGLFLVLCIGLCACGSADSGSSSRKEEKSSSDSKDKDKKDKDTNDNDAGGFGNLLSDLKDSDKPNENSNKGGNTAADEKPADNYGKSDEITAQPGLNGKNDTNGEKTEESGDKKDAGSSDQGAGKSDRNIVHKFYELVTVDGHTRDEFLNNEELADAYSMWDFYAYGSGVEVSFDYDTGYVQYTWYIVSTNAFSSAPVDNPSAVDCILDYTMFLNAGDEPDRIPISVSYSDDTIVQTFTEGGGVCVYKLTE